MQKKIVALAIAGLFSGAVYAQSNVTVYGRADLSYVYSKSDFKKFQGVEQGQGLGGGGSRLGFQGEEALGNGLKAIFKFEWGTNIDEGGGPVGARYTYVGLAGNFGQVTLGRNGTPSDLWLGATGVNGISGYEPNNLFRPGVGGGIIGGDRWDNSIAYSSPNFSGLDFMALYSFGERVNSSKDGKNTCYDKDGKEITTGSPTCDDVSTSSAGKLGLGLRYANGPLYLAAAYHVRKDDKSRIDGGAGKPWDADSAGAKGWGIGGSYDFKVVKVFANYFRGKVNHNMGVDGTDIDGSNKQTTWSLSVGVPVSSAGTVIAEYAQYKDYRDFVDDADGKSPGHKAKGYSLGYKHTLSKRTILHTYVTRIDNDRTIDSNGGWKKTGVAGEDQTIFSAGIVHLF